MDTITTQMQERFAGFDTFIRIWIADYGQDGGRIHCGKGCSGCCSLTVNATFPEAFFLAESLSNGQAEHLAAHVARLVSLLPHTSDLKTFLGRHRKEIGPCPLLDAAGSCGVYGQRPFSCRALLATRESHWCSADFGTLSSGEKEAFVAGLDRNVVAFPMHYAEAPQELGRELEARTAREMRERCGFSLYGNLPVLLHLEREHGLSRTVAEGRRATEELLKRTGLNHPFIVMLEAGA